MINVNLSRMKVLIEHHQLIPISVTLIGFQDHSCVKQFYPQIYVYSRLSWNFVQLSCQVDYEYTTIFDFHNCLKEIIDILSPLKNF